jgi:hypothetical protein
MVTNYFKDPVWLVLSLVGKEAELDNPNTHSDGQINHVLAPGIVGS